MTVVGFREKRPMLFTFVADRYSLVSLHNCVFRSLTLEALGRGHGTSFQVDFKGVQIHPLHLHVSPFQLQVRGTPLGCSNTSVAGLTAGQSPTKAASFLKGNGA